MIDIENTGERILLDKETPLMIARHFSAYNFAKKFVLGNVVLDIGCGEGYGTCFLATFAKEILGIDYDAAAVKYAGSKYLKDNLKFINLDVKDINILNLKFDTICSFQNIEHIEDTGSLLKNIKNLLKDNGVFICSTPNRLDASPGSVKPFNKFHVKEYLLSEFKELLSGYFSKVDIFGLKRGGRLNFYRMLKKSGAFNFLPSRLNPVKNFYSRIDYTNFKIIETGVDNALDFIAVCRK